MEELSPDSIDAHTFDFETIGHPNMDPVLQQGSLDLDSLAESPESDFMSAVNEFVIEENLASPNPISDPTSPEMMVESLYSSVINAIDSKRIQDTTTLERENSRLAVLKQCIEKYRSAAEESQCNLKSVKEDLYHFRGLVLKEQRDFGFSLKTMSMEVRSIVESIKYTHDGNLNEMHQNELCTLKGDHEKELLALKEESEMNQNMVKDLQRAILELEGTVERKEKEIAQLESERDRTAESESRGKRQLLDLEQKIADQSNEMKTIAQSRDTLADQLEHLHFEIERSQQKIRVEMEGQEKSRLQELEQRLRQQHAGELGAAKEQGQAALDLLVDENVTKLKELVDLHAAELTERDGRVKDLESRVSELSDMRCKLEVEMALKETEMEDLRLLYQEARCQEQETLNSRVEAETDSLRRQIGEEHEVGLAELRTLMRIEKDHCISELVDRHEEESALLRNEFATLQEEARETERSLIEQVQTLQNDLEDQAAALKQEKDNQERTLQGEQQHLKKVICDLEAQNELLSKRLGPELAQSADEQREEAVKAALSDALKNFEQQKEEIEERLLTKVKQLEKELEERGSSER